MELNDYLARVVKAVRTWEASWGAFETHPALQVDEERFVAALDGYVDRLGGNYPFFHPRYAGQMLKPPHPAAVAAYVAAMLINPNNHALDGGPPTGAMEKEVVRDLASMFGFPESTLGHLTSSGTIANLEALWVARELHPGRGVAFSEAAHYTHGRMSQVLGVHAEALPTDAAGRLDLDALEEELRTGTIGTAVVTAGTTGLGAVDPVADVVALARAYGCRVHADAAYGGFFALLADSDDAPLSDAVRRHLQALAACDSIVVDPHKHGLQPYGCGCVLFRDPSVGRFYKHDSPYTYFTSDELHLGEISLECSRAGAAAGALWLTLQVLPPVADDGLGSVLQAGLRAARSWYERLESADELAPFVRPELDIVTFYPVWEGASVRDIDAASRRIFEQAMQDPDDPVFLSVLRASAVDVARKHDGLVVDQDHVQVLRSVLMKPEHEHHVGDLHERVVRLARDVAERVSN